MAVQWWGDDDSLLASLRDALSEAAAVPRAVIEAGKAAFTWRDGKAAFAGHDIDAEFARLIHDSARDASREELAATRSEPAPLRYLTFTSAEFTIELEVTADALLGQIVPPGPGEIEILPDKGLAVTTAIDEVGCFAIRPIPPGSFRLLCRIPTGANVLTGWITP
jgi:hypothetical protein